MVEQLSDGVWGWKGGEGITLHKSGGGGSSAPAIVELSNEVFPKVHLGVRAALDALPDGVEFVLAIGAAPAPIEADVMEKLVLKVGPADPILAALQKAFKLIDDGIAEGGVLVVSEDGEEEAAAAAIVVGWAMARQGVKFADAPALVAKARPSATLNANFEKQLKVWETWKEFPGVPEWM